MFPVIVVKEKVSHLIEFKLANGNIFDILALLL